MDDHREIPQRYYRSLPLDAELWLLNGLANLNVDNSIDALGWPWFNYRDMRVLLNRAYSAELSVNGIDCMIRNGGSWNYDVTLEPTAGTANYSNFKYQRNWFFSQFDKRVTILRDQELLDQAAFSCTLASRNQL